MLVSRAAPELVMRLFEQEVPEIYDGTVVIRGCAREAGERTKIAVQSRDRDVDSVGACVGMKGMRVQSIIRELRGEKIDIIEFSEDPVVFATHALSPAKVSRIVDHRSARKAHGSDRRRFAALARHRQEGAERPPGGQAARLEDRYQERRREAAGSRVADGRAGGPRCAGVGAHRVRAGGDDRRRAGERRHRHASRNSARMTPEQLEEIQGIGAGAIEQLQDAVNAYYNQFEDNQGVENPEQNLPEATPESADLSASAEELAEVQGTRHRIPRHRAGTGRDAGRTNGDDLSAGDVV